MTLEYEMASANLSRQLEWVRAADSKIPPMFAVNSAMLAVTGGLLASRGFSIEALSFCDVMATGLLVLSLILLAMAAIPKLGRPRDSLIFFGGIVRMGEERFLAAIQTVSSEELVEELSYQTFLNANIAERRYQIIRRSYQATFVSLPFWLVSSVGYFS